MLPLLTSFVLLPGHGIDLAGMDRSVKVQSPADLYRFSNGRWVDTFKMPADKPYAGTFDDIEERNNAILRRICEREAKAKPPLSTAGGMVGLFYRLAMDEARRNRLDGTPLRPELTRIAAIKDAKGLLRAIAHLETIGVQPGFGGGIGLDDLDARRVLFTLSQPDLMLNDRDLYLGNDDRAKAARAQYRSTVGKLLSFSGLPQEGAADALALETALAKASSTPEELRDPAANYHPMSQAALRSLTPHLPWDAYFTELGKRPALVNVTQPRALKAFDALVASRPLSAWRNMLRASLVQNFSSHLSKRYDDESFKMSRVLTGQQTLSPRWKRSVRVVDGSVGDALGQLYVREAFPPEAKAKARKMVGDILSALHDRILELDWMSEPTKRQALAKLAAVTVKVGYPDHWRDYATLELRDDSIAQNVMRARAYEWRRDLAKLGRPVDRSEWGLTASTVNAYYNPNWNEIVFPAGILQPGFFDPKADNASNYGAIGAVVGHEMTHGFDDEGSQFDARGLRRDWWTKEDKARYEAKGRAIVAQYGAYKSGSGFPVNGKLTEGENIADIGGLTLAFLAYRKSLNGVEPPVVDGLTGDQRFFVAWSQNWRSKIRPELEKLYVNMDAHSPDVVRSMGAAADTPAFYRAFGLPVPENLPGVW